MKDDYSSDTTEVAASLCEKCQRPLRGRRFVHMAGSSVTVFCSDDCLRARVRETMSARSESRRRRAGRLAVSVSLVGAILTPHQGLGPPRVHASSGPAAGYASALGQGKWFGPVWPPTEASWLNELGHDAWIHPLAGPFRRMPQSDGRVFGADRPGDRPIECRNGHCGVDIGGEIWGEHVHAAHDGVVDRVQRAPNEERGGHYVRLSHRGGTVFTQYFHLAAIPRGLAPGVPVKAGDVIGLLGDTGVKESTAHLHFTISVRPAPDWPEQYIDPEPLIALCPLRIPFEGSAVGLVTTVANPGVPLGSAPLKPAHKRALAKRKQAAEALSKNAKNPKTEPAKTEPAKGETAKSEASPADKEPASSAASSPSGD